MEYKSQFAAKIAKLAAKGLQFGKEVSLRQCWEFYKKYQPMIDWVSRHARRDCGVSLGACSVRAILWMENDRHYLIEFLQEVHSRTFRNGPVSPAYAYWKWVSRNLKPGNESEFPYLRVVHTIRMYVKMRRGIKYKRHVRPAEADMFTWSDNSLTKMIGKASRVSTLVRKAAPDPEEINALFEAIKT